MGLLFLIQLKVNVIFPYRISSLNMAKNKMGWFVSQLGNNLPAARETWVQSLGWEDPLEKGKATHSSILAWRIPWTV